MEHADQPAGGVLRSCVGDRLRSAREARELSIEDVAAHTRVPRRLLEMIEASEHDGLPAPTYSAGFVKTYAQFVGLDGGELARLFREELGRSVQDRHSPQPFEPADPARVPSRLLAVVALIVALLIAGGYAVWRGRNSEDTARLAAGTTAPVAADTMAAAPAAPTALAPVIASPVVVPPALPAGAPVVLTATDAVWFKVYERGGRTLYTGEMPAGQSFTVPPDAVDPLVRTGKPEALAVTVGGQAIPPLGKPSTLVRDASLGRDALLARVAAASAAAPQAARSPPAGPTP